MSQEEIFMTDQPTSTNPEATAADVPTSADAVPKWWGNSMTVWGALITGAATVLPTIAPLAGLDISSDIAQQFGNEVLRVVQGVTGIAGLVLTVYGRMRAAQPLERRIVSIRL
jgi:hypothetical protein